MFRVRTCRCTCCGLEQHITIDLQAPSAPPVCARCDGHRATQRLPHDDHVVMYRRALEEAQDAVSLAHGERDFHRDRSVEAVKGSAILGRALTAIDDLHHDRGGRCSCGETPCPVQRVLAAPNVARLLGIYDDQQLTMMELRNANPGAFAPEWDYVDVTLVYPPRVSRSGGRHRAAG